jgi:hypothetical protein
MEFAVSYRGGVWASIAVDIARAESSESEVEWLKAIPLTEAFGVTGPDALPCLPLRLHVAQKLHGMTLPPRPDKRNERFRDLIDLLLLETPAAPSRPGRPAMVMRPRHSGRGPAARTTGSPCPSIRGRASCTSRPSRAGDSLLSCSTATRSWNRCTESRSPGCPSLSTRRRPQRWTAVARHAEVLLPQRGRRGRAEELPALAPQGADGRAALK